MRVSPPSRQAVDDQPSSQDPMAENMELGKGQNSSCLLLEPTVESPHWEPPVESMAQVSSCALLLLNVATWRESKEQRGRREEKEVEWSQFTSSYIMHIHYVWL